MSLHDYGLTRFACYTLPSDNKRIIRQYIVFFSIIELTFNTFKKKTGLKLRRSPARGPDWATSYRPEPRPGPGGGSPLKSNRSAVIFFYFSKKSQMQTIQEIPCQQMLLCQGM